jgi:formylglycine-generating enzyme required for sulfatase activity
MKTLKQWIRPCAIAAVMVFVFTGCSDGNNGGGSVKGIAVTGVTLDETHFTLKAGDTKTLTATVTPANATNKKVIWSSSDTDVAIVSEGVVYPISPGDATITVTTQNGRKTAKATVTVPAPDVITDVTGVEMDKSILFLFYEESADPLFTQQTALLTHTVLPINATDKRVTWESGDSDVVTVTVNPSTGVATVAVVGVGKTDITVKTVDGNKTATSAVTVVAKLPPPGNTIEMVWIPPGTFMMGSPVDEPESYGNEIQHQVTLTEGFYMGIYPVRQGDFEDYMNAKPSTFPNVGDGNKFAEYQTTFPVECVNWYEAIIFCNELSDMEGLSPAYTMYKATAPGATGTTMSGWTNIPANWSTDTNDWGTPPSSISFRWDNVRVVAGSDGYRLPTEAQWEYACRAGTTTPFNTGDNITAAQANYRARFPYNGQEDPDAALTHGQPIPVGMYDPNVWGLYDMHGNVAEWCWDWHGSYIRNGAGATDTDPTGPATGENRVVRGGSWGSNGNQLRSAYRGGLIPSSFTNILGFRVVRPYIAPSEG